MSLSEIKLARKTLMNYAKHLAVINKIATQESFEQGVFLTETTFDSGDAIIKLILNLEAEHLHISDIECIAKNLDMSRKVKLECTRMLEHYKERVRDLENEIKEYQEKINKKNIPFKNLNDLNSAKFLTNNEKRQILGFPAMEELKK